MGCKANLTDSQALEIKLQAMGGFPGDGDVDLFLLNTCTVTDNADREALQILRKTKASLTVAAGCMAEVSSENIEAFTKKQEGRDFRVLRNSAKDTIEKVVGDWLGGKNEKHIIHGDRAAWHQKILDNIDAGQKGNLEDSARTRSFFKVQDGCNAFCSYCVIPLARGRSRSIPVAKIIDDLNKIYENGTKEVVLTAIHAADYQSDGLDFVGLVKTVVAQTKLQRIRLTSLDPAEITDELLSFMRSESRVCPHFHASIQSANAKVLFEMKRQYDANQVEERLMKINEMIPHAYVGMDIITGFPGETELEFQDSFDRLQRLPWTRAHVFPYSVRRNTAAARLVENGFGISQQVSALRAKKIRDLSDQKLAVALQSKIGTVQEVLVEEKRVSVDSRVCSQGRARNYHRVVIPGVHPVNQLVRARIIGVFGSDSLKGELL